MHFCSVCDNMYYIRISEKDEDKLIYYCRKCGHTDDELISDPKNVCVSKTHVRKKGATFDHLVNEYTKLDPTLPRIGNIKCPNPNCPSNEQSDESPETSDSASSDKVIYLRYDDDNIRFVYICPRCDTIWKSATNK